CSVLNRISWAAKNLTWYPTLNASCESWATLFGSNGRAKLSSEQGVRHPTIIIATVMRNPTKKIVRNLSLLRLWNTVTKSRTNLCCTCNKNLHTQRNGRL